jgi:hypothetical protein
VAPPKPDPATATPPAPPPTTAAPQPEQERPPIQEILSAADAARLKQGLDNFRAQIQDALAKLPPPNRQNSKQKQGVSDIRFNMGQAKTLEDSGALRQAYYLAERAFALAQGLQSAR